MKTERLILYITLLLTVSNSLLLVLHLTGRDSFLERLKPRDIMLQEPSSSDISVPERMNLAGEETPLKRLDVREAYKKELIVNTYLHSHTIQIIKQAPRYFSVIEPILKEEGVPDDFKYLAVIESRLNPTVVSPAGAVGIWQIMKGTGRELGLEINDEVDERYHLEKATRAACSYLKKAYGRFGSWTLAAASYNAGMNMIRKQMSIQQEDNYYNLLLGEETERYVYRILAMKQIMLHPERYRFNVHFIYAEEDVKKIEVKGRIKDLAVFAREHGITYKTLKRFNPWLRKSSLKNPRHKTYLISIPTRKQLYR